VRIANRPCGRGPQILRHLIEYGALSTRSLSAILQPQIDKNNLRDSLNRLYKRRLVIKRDDKINSGSAVYYEITRDKNKWNEIAKMANVAVCNFEAALARPVERLHSELCAVWIEKLKRIYPEALFFKDHAVTSSELCKSYLATKGDDRESLPDFLMLMKSKDGSEPIAVAFEVERFAKSEKRIVQKLRKYSSGSLLDGVVYINDDASISKKIIRLYNGRARKDATRINNYGGHFLLCRDTTNPPVDNSICAGNCDGKIVDMSRWVSVLSKISLIKRYDHSF